MKTISILPLNDACRLSVYVVIVLLWSVQQHVVSSFLVTVPHTCTRLYQSSLRSNNHSNGSNNKGIPLCGSFFDDLFNGGGSDEKNKKKKNADDNQLPFNEEELSQILSSSSSSPSLDEPSIQEQQKPQEKEEEEEISLASFQAEMAKRQQQQQQQVSSTTTSNLDDFDGYDMRDVIYKKWGQCFDLDFNRVDSFGFRNLYVNVMPFCLGSKRFRHQTEMDYLCHLQAIVEILIKYDQLEYVLYQIEETKKKPRGNTSPLIAVPIRLDLTPEQVKDIMGY